MATSFTTFPNLNKISPSGKKMFNPKVASDNADYLRVIDAGLPRTGTTSLKAALEILGFGPCHHMIELIDKPEQSKIFSRAFDGEKINFHDLLKGYGSSVDAPTAIFYKEIHQAYPKAKIILTVRDSGEKWFESFQNTIGPAGTDIFFFITIYPIRFMRLQGIVVRKMIKKWIKDYGKLGPNTHDLYNAQVIKENKREELLVFNVKEGWGPLCKYLNVPIPQDVPFPNLNDAEHMRRLIANARRTGYCAWALIFAVGAVFIYFFISIFH